MMAVIALLAWTGWLDFRLSAGLNGTDGKSADNIADLRIQQPQAEDYCDRNSEWMSHCSHSAVILAATQNTSNGKE